MLNKPLIKKWVDALRSGEFGQTTGRLGKVDETGEASYCCLGVLCEIALADGLELDRKVDESHKEITFNGFGGLPPIEVAHHAGLANEENLDDFGDTAWTVPITGVVQRFVGDRVGVDGDLAPALHIYSGNRVALADLNDSGAATFYEIADAIEVGLLR